MELFTPAYYKDFQCLAAACPDSCCQEWEVDVDPVSAARYQALPGPLGDRLRQVLRQEDGCTRMTITRRRCPMWRQDGLCQIQTELGHDALCQTCRDYPRLRHDFGSFAELGLELSCPEAARLIFSCKDTSLCRQQAPGGEMPEYDRQSMAILLESRQAALAFLVSCTCTLPEALAGILLYAHNVQSALDGGALLPLEPEQLLSSARRYAGAADINGVFDFFLRLEILTDRWKKRLENGPVTACWQERLRPLAGYGIGRYWLQAISDGDLVCRVKFILLACILVNALGGDPVSTAQLFSKEIENDPDNVDALLDGAYTCPAFTDMALLGLLLG